MDEQTTFWREPGLDDLELLRARFVTHVYAPHAHEGYAIGVIEIGAERFSYRGEQHVAAAGDVVLINPGEIHTGQAATPAGWAYRMLYPSAAIMQQAAVQLAGRPRVLPHFGQPVIRDDAQAEALRALHRALEAPLEPLERDTLFLAAMVPLLVRHADWEPLAGSPRAARAEVLRAQRFLERHHAEHPSLEQLAGHVGLSPFHLLRVFKQETGATPHAYLTHVRVSHARRLLAAGRAPADVAAETGFADQSHLSRTFKRIVGVPPGKFTYDRKNLQDAPSIGSLYLNH